MEELERGWTEKDGGWTYIGLPNQAIDSTQIRKLYEEHVQPLLVQLPDPVGVIVVGAAFRAILGWSRTSVVLVGPPGSGKTALADVVSQFFSQSAISPARGSSLRVIQRAMHTAKESIVILDDVFTGYSPGVANERMGELIRQQFNQMSMLMTSRNGARPELTPRGSLFITSERFLKGAASHRAIELDLSVPLQLDRSDLGEILIGSNAQAGRAQLMAATVSWMTAKGPREFDQWALSRSAQLAHDRQGIGVPDRDAEARADIQMGWELLQRVLEDTGALPDAELADLAAHISRVLDNLPQRTDHGDSALTAPTPPSRGRAPIGAAFSVRVPTALLTEIDEYASAHGLTRAETMRIAAEQLVTPKDGPDV